MYLDNPLYARQLKRVYHLFERRDFSLGLADKLLFKETANKRIEDFLKDPGFTEEVAILDAMIEIIPSFIETYSIKK